MATSKRPKSQSVTNKQKQTMADYLSSHSELSKGKFTHNFTHSTGECIQITDWTRWNIEHHDRTLKRMESFIVGMLIVKFA